MKNKHIASLLLASSSLLFTACSEDSTPLETSLTDQSISFAPYIEQTRASVADIETLKADGFRVWISHNHGDTFDRAADNVSYLYNEDVQFSMPLDTWDYTNKRFWPADDAKLSFFALANGGEYLSTEHTKTSAGAPVYTFEAPATMSDQVDLLATQDLNRTKTTHQIRFDFQHMLSKIAFTAHANLPAHSTATLTKVEVCYAPDKLHNKATVDLNDLSISAVADAYYTGGEAIRAGVLFESQEGVQLGETPIVLGNEVDDFLMLVPQVYEEGDIYLRVSYVLDTDDSSHYDGEGPSFKEEYLAEKIDLPICIDDMEQNIGWQKGSQYTYQIEISADAVDFNGSISVANWDAPADQPVKDVEKVKPSIYYQDEVYHITNAEGLVVYSAIVNGHNTEEVAGYPSGVPNSNFAKGQLDNDIDLSQVCGPTKGSWIPIGNDGGDGQPFYGQFDGQGHYVDNLYIHAADKNEQGLFGGTTYHSRISNVKMRGAQVTGSYYLGALVGHSSATITNCHFEAGGLRASSFQGTSHVGTLVGGHFSGSITDCSVYIGTSSVSLITDSECSGGFVGRIRDGIIKNCSVRTDHDGQLHVISKGQHAGGFSGHVDGGLSINCSVSSTNLVQAPIQIKAPGSASGFIADINNFTAVGCSSAVTSIDCSRTVGYGIGYIYASNVYGCWAYCDDEPNAQGFVGSSYGEYNIYHSTFGTSPITDMASLNQDIASYNTTADADKQCDSYTDQGTYGPIATNLN